MFSQGRHILPFTRNRLSGTSTRAILCLGSWGRSDLLQMSDLVAAVSARRGKKRKRASNESGEAREAPRDNVIDEEVH